MDLVTTLEAIELVKSTPASGVSADQLAALKDLLGRTPSVYAVLGGRSHVHAYLREAETAIQSGVAVAVEALPEKPVVDEVRQPPGPPPLPWNVRWTRRRLVELGVFAALFIAAGGGIFALLLSMNDPAPPPSPGSASRQNPVDHEPTARSAATVERGGENSSATGTAEGSEPADVWQGWQLTKMPATRAEKRHDWDLTEPAKPRPIRRLVTSGGKVTFERRQIVPENTSSLWIDCKQTAAAPLGTIEVSIDGQALGKASVPAGSVAEPMLIPARLAAGSNVVIQVVYSPGGESEEVQWRSMRLSDERVEALAATGEPDATQPSLRLWLRADRGIKDGAGHGPLDPAFAGHVATWEDQASHKFHFVRGDVTGPKYMPAEPLFANKPGVVMGGAFLKHAGKRIYDTPISTSFLVFTVQGLRRKEYGRYAAIAETSVPTLGWHTGAYHDRRGRYDHEVTFVGCKPIPMVSKRLPMGTFGLIAAASVAGPRSFIEINGRGRSIFDSSAEPSGDTFILGGGHASPGAYGGAIAELIIYNRRLSDVEIRQIGRYLQTRYGIAGDY